MKDKKPTLKELYNRNATYLDTFRRKLDRLFLYNPLDVTFKMPKRMELILHDNGSLGWDKVHKCWVEGAWDGRVDENNDYVAYIATTLNTDDKKTYTLKNHEEVIVCGNNSTYTPDNLDNKWYSMILEETDISTYFQLINSRNIPMISATDDNIKKEVNLAFEKLTAGKPVVIGTGLLGDAKTLDITDPSSIDKISNLDNFHDEMIKRWCNKYGVDVETKEKKAQVNNMELDRFGDWDSLNFLEMYESRLDFIKEMEENGITIELIRNPIYWDEPTNEDVENGTFEENEEEEGNDNADENNNIETDSTTEEDGKQTADDDK